MSSSVEHNPPDVKTPVDVTVVMPAMNRETLIGAALDSIALQTVRVAEVIVVDDASVDRTVEIARQHGARVIALEVNGGSGPARNRGIQEAQTEWVAFLDSDDLWMPSHLERCLEASAGRVLVGAPGRSTVGRVIGNSWGRDIEVTSRSVLVPGDLICTSGTVVRRDALLQAGLFRPLRRAQDLDMWVRVLEHGDGLALGAPGFTYSVHDAQAINDDQLMRQCFAQIVTWCSTRPWFSDRDADRAWARWHWDDLRTALRTGDRRGAAAQAAWFARRPHVWSTVVNKLRERRRARHSVDL